MPYVTSVQRIGREEGRMEGLMEGEAALLRRLLVRRFGALPERVDEQLARTSTEQLETWGERMLEAVSFTEVLGQSGPSSDPQ